VLERTIDVHIRALRQKNGAGAGPESKPSALWDTFREIRAESVVSLLAASPPTNQQPVEPTQSQIRSLCQLSLGKVHAETLVASLIALVCARPGAPPTQLYPSTCQTQCKLLRAQRHVTE